jgi:hypothetical protein
MKRAPPPYINPGTPFDFPLLSTQVIQGDQAIYSNEKYLKWVRNTSDESNNLNHHTFTIQANDVNFITKFNPTNSDIIIKNSLEQSSVNGGNIQFQDPWLIDYPDPQYGNTKRNQGMDAPFKQRTSPFYPDFTTSYNGDVYKGVFLNQDFRVPNQPYYSVKADYLQTFNLSQTGRTHKFYFQGWSANPQSGAEFQNANALETPVVFKQPNTTVAANYKGKQLNNS